MEFCVVNQTYKKVRIENDCINYVLCAGEKANFFTADNANFKVDVLEKNMVLLNWLYALIDGFVDSESVVNSLVCNVSFSVINPHFDSVIVELKDLEYRDDQNGYIYESVYVKCENGTVCDTKYTLTDVKKSRRKALFYYICVTSWLPVIMLLLGLFIDEPDFLTAVATIIILCVASVPSWRKAGKLKSYYTNEKADILLNKRIAQLMSNSGEQKEEHSKNFFNRMMFKFFDKIFK